MAKIIINNGEVTSSDFSGKKAFKLKATMENPYHNSHDSWIIGSSAKSGWNYKIYQDSNNNGKFDSSDKSHYVAKGSISKKHSKLLFQIKPGNAHIEGYSDMTASLSVFGKKISTAKWW